MSSTVITPGSLVRPTFNASLTVTSVVTNTANEAAIYVAVKSVVLFESSEAVTRPIKLTWWVTGTPSTTFSVTAVSLDGTQTLNMSPLVRGKSYTYRVSCEVSGQELTTADATVIIKDIETTAVDTPAAVASGFAPQLLFPTNGGTLYGATKTFQMVANSTAVTDWYIRAGDGSNGIAYVDWRAYSGDDASPTFSTFPADGSTVTVEFSYKTVVDGWTINIVTFISGAPGGTVTPPPVDDAFYSGTITAPIIQSPVRMNMADMVSYDSSDDRFWAGGPGTVARAYGDPNYTRDLILDGRDVPNETRNVLLEGWRFAEVIGATITSEHTADALDPTKQAGNTAHSSYGSTYTLPTYRNQLPRIANHGSVKSTTTDGVAFIGCHIDTNGAEGDTLIGNQATSFSTAAYSEANFKVYFLYSRIEGVRGTVCSIHGDFFQNQKPNGIGHSGYGLYVEQCDLFSLYNGFTPQSHGPGPWRRAQLIDLYFDYDHRFAFTPVRAEHEAAGGSWAYDLRPDGQTGPRFTGRFSEELTIRGVHYRGATDTYDAFGKVKYGADASSGDTANIYARLFADGSPTGRPISQWSDGMTQLPGSYTTPASVLSGPYAGEVASLVKAAKSKIGVNFVW